MDGLLDDIKDGFRPANLADAGKVTVGAVGGAIIAKLVVTALGDLRKGKDERADKKTMMDTREKLLPKWAPGIAPLVVGVAVAGATSRTAPRVGAGVAAGMFVVGAGSILKAVLEKGAAEAAAKNPDSFYVKFYNNLAGLGEVDTYDSALLAGLGQMGEYDYGVGRYMNGAVVVPQTLRGAAVDIQSINGLGASPTTVSISGPMSASLYA